MKISVKEMAVFSMLGALMYASKMIMEFMPNVHLIGVFIVAMTVVFRWKALYPIYVFAFLTGLLNGFGTWWWPYLYIWLPPFFATMLLPKNMPKKAAPFVYMAICSLHGFLYGTLYAPFQAIVFLNGDLKKTLVWIAQGLPWDCVHGISNFVLGALIVPLIKVLKISCKAIGIGVKENNPEE
ncbi:MAG: hypothetical protein K6E32_05330 [Lachnospiraceae bacterium]|nr:hypothetical protein [Lachnospiraceae bacterium]